MNKYAQPAHYEEPSYHADPYGYDGEDVHADHYESEVYGDVPHGDFFGSVHDFNEWDEVWTQDDYESRINTEAELMVALEALREALVDLDYEIDYLDDCIDSNEEGIDDNSYGIHHNEELIEENTAEIDDQNYQVKRLQKACRKCQAAMEEDRDVLVLHCQQFAFATDMVGPCADILTCAGTELPYRVDFWQPVSTYYAH